MRKDTYPDYPAETAVQHGAWLRQFTAQLPALASRCGLTPTEVGAAQQLAGLYYAWLRSHLAEQAVQTTAGEFILLQIRELTERLYQHPAFGPADAHALRLQRAPWDITLPTPRVPEFSAVLYPGKRVVLLWKRRRAADLTIQVCRDGATWCDLVVGQTKSGRFNDPVSPLLLPTTWYYRGRYNDPADASGAWSDLLCVPLLPTTKEATKPVVFPNITSLAIQRTEQR